jgi:hypothetical protein
VYNTFKAISLDRFPNGPLLRNNIVNGNIFFPLLSSQTGVFYWNGELNVPTVTDIQSDMRAIAAFDNNIYRNDVDNPFDYYYHLTNGGTFVDPPPLNFNQWTSFMNQDFSSKTTPAIPAYTINSYNTGNTVQNPQFTAGTSGVTFWSGNNNFAGSWDNTGKISGGSVKIAPYSSTGEYSTFYAPLGSVTAGKNYILRFTTLGTNPFGVVRASLRQSNSPWATFTTPQTRLFGTSQQTHEILITPSVSEANASYLIEVIQSAGTVYIDNLEFYEVNTTPIDVTTQVRFEYNPTQTNKVISLDASYVGVDYTKYSGNVTLAPYTSKIFIRDNSAPQPPIVQQPGSTLTAASSAPAINCFGGSTNVTVSASGGTSPYSGTGTFSASAGSGTLRLSASNPVSGNYTMAYYSIGAVSSSKNYVLRFSTLGTSASGSVRASFRMSAAPFSLITATQTKSFGTSRVDHQFIFTAPTSTSDGSFLIEVDQASGTTYIDNVAVFEAAADGTLTGPNLYAPGNFESGISQIWTWSPTNNHSAQLDNNSMINNTNYYSVTDAAGTVRTTGVVISQPASALQASATAQPVAVVGGLTTVNVTASGGTAPYNGAGQFTVGVGNYSYTVTDAKGCSSVVTVSVTLQTTNVVTNPGPGNTGSGLSVTGTAPAISCFGGSTNVSISASGGSTPYSGTGTFSATAGSASLKLSANNPVAGTYTLVYYSIGAVSSSKNYVLRFSTLGTTGSGAVRASMRLSASPYTSIASAQTRSFGASRVDHQFIFSAPTSTTDGSFLIELDQASGTTYIDNIAVFEAAADGTLTSTNLYNPGNFESGLSQIWIWSPSNNHIAQLDNSAVINNTNYYSVTDATGAVRTTGVVISQPEVALQAYTLAPPLSANGTTTITVTANGGIQPYKGTGSYVVGPGYYSYTVTDAGGCSSTAYWLVNPVTSGALQLSATASPVGCFGGTTTATVNAGGGTAPYTGTGSFGGISAGKGSLMLSFKSATNNYTLNYSSIGSVSSSKTYILRFSTLGTGANGTVRASLRQTASPYSSITGVQTSNFGTARVDHQFIFTGPSTTADASFLIEIGENSGSVYLDNIAFFESNATGDLLGQNLFAAGDFESGISNMFTWSLNSNHIAAWDQTAKINSTRYFTVTDATGIENSVGVVISQPDLPLQAYTLAPPLANGTTTITVTANGGT